MENELVFIVGLPRTGSTLLRSLLNRSDRICICNETHFLDKWARTGPKKKIVRFGDLRVEKNLDEFVNVIYSNDSEKTFWPWLYKNISRQEFQHRLMQTDRSERAIFELLMHIYAEKKKGVLSPDLILGEKTPANLRHIPTLLKWFPEARIIHTFRDPRAICVSAVKLGKAGKWGWKDKLRPVPQILMNSAVEGSMAIYILRAWLSASRLHTLYSKLYPYQYCLVRFEDFLVGPEIYLRRLCEFLGVPYQPAMLEEVAVIESSYRAQRIVKEGIDTNAAERWKGHIHPLTRALFNTLGKRQLEAFGYRS